MTMTDGHTSARLESGDHVCFVFNSEEHRRSGVLQWAREGLAAGERVVSVESRRPNGAGANPGSLLTLLAQDGVDCARHLANGQLKVMTPTETYSTHGRIDLPATFAAHRIFIEQTLAQGYPGVRMTADVTLALDVLGTVDLLIDSEHRFDRLCQDFKLSGLCQYNSSHFVDETLTTIAEVHQGGIVDPQVHVARSGGVVRLIGEIDCSNAHLLAGLLRGCDFEEPLVVDAAQLHFIDASGLRALASVASRSNTGLHLVSADSHVQKVVGWCGFEHWLSPTIS